MLVRDDQQVRWSLRIKISNYDTAIILINDIGRRGTRENLTKEAILFAHDLLMLTNYLLYSQQKVCNCWRSQNLTRIEGHRLLILAFRWFAINLDNLFWQIY